MCTLVHACTRTCTHASSREWGSTPPDAYHMCTCISYVHMHTICTHMYILTTGALFWAFNDPGSKLMDAPAALASAIRDLPKHRTSYEIHAHVHGMCMYVCTSAIRDLPKHRTSYEIAPRTRDCTSHTRLHLAHERHVPRSTPLLSHTPLLLSHTPLGHRPHCRSVTLHSAKLSPLLGHSLSDNDHVSCTTDLPLTMYSVPLTYH